MRRVLLAGAAFMALAVAAPAHAATDPAGATVPEPAAWALMIGGFAFVGGLLRRRNLRAALPV